ncbi:MAG: tetratricopeptide repeat protein [Burkholderiaceae bacterium]
MGMVRVETWSAGRTVALRVGLVLAGLVGLAGCADLSDGPAAGRRAAPEALFHDEAFGAPTVAVDPAAVFALSPAMRDYLHREIEPQVDAHGLQAGLVDTLYSESQLALAYDGAYTRTAAEAFDARAGNCLSLAIMTGAFAKELGLLVRYREVLVDDSWGRDGDLVERFGHVNISVGKPVPMVRAHENSPNWWTVDFLPAADIRRQRAEPITEHRVVAMYMNNKSAEALARNQVDNAYAWARAAIAADPAFADAYNTLGAVYLRRGLPAAAEVALRTTLAQRSEHGPALANLVLALRRQGRVDDAAAVDAQLQRLQAASPFAAFQRARQAFDAGDYAQARDLFERVLRRSNDYHEFHFWLALSYLRLGDRDRAVQHLRLAEENSNTRQQQSAYAAKLQRLKAAAGAGEGG